MTTETTWITLPGYTQYEINRHGDVRSLDGQLQELHSSASGDYYLLQADAGGHPMTIFKQDLTDDASVLFTSD